MMQRPSFGREGDDIMSIGPFIRSARMPSDLITASAARSKLCYNLGKWRKVSSKQEMAHRSVNDCFRFNERKFHREIDSDVLVQEEGEKFWSLDREVNQWSTRKDFCTSQHSFIASRMGVLIGDVCDLRLELLRIRRADLKSIKLFVLRPHNFKQSKST